MVSTLSGQRHQRWESAMAGSAKDQKQGWPFIPPGSFFLHHSPTPLGNYLRRMKAKLGPKAATMATAHKIAVIFYTMVKNQLEYDESIWPAKDAQREKRLEARLK